MMRLRNTGYLYKAIRWNCLFCFRRYLRREFQCIDRFSVDDLGQGGSLYRVICDSKQASHPTQTIDRNSVDTLNSTNIRCHYCEAMHLHSVNATGIATNLILLQHNTTILEVKSGIYRVVLSHGLRYLI
jgi:hypothetical protein